MHTLVLLGNLRTATLFEELGESTTGWSDVMNSVSNALEEDVDLPLANATSILSGSIATIGDVQYYLDQYIALFGDGVGSIADKMQNDSSGLPVGGSSLLQRRHQDATASIFAERLGGANALDGVRMKGRQSPSVSTFSLVQEAPKSQLVPLIQSLANVTSSDIWRLINRTVPEAQREELVERTRSFIRGTTNLSLEEARAAINNTICATMSASVVHLQQMSGKGTQGDVCEPFRTFYRGDSNLALLNDKLKSMSFYDPPSSYNETMDLILEVYYNITNATEPPENATVVREALRDFILNATNITNPLDYEEALELLNETVHFLVPILLTPLEAKLVDLWNEIEPALNITGEFLYRFADKVQHFLEDFSKSLDRAQKVFDLIMNNFKGVGEGKEQMEYDTFNLFDVSGTGWISVDDLKEVSVMYDFPALAGEKAEELHKDYDVNQDGKIKEDEFSLLVEDDTVPGVMSEVLRQYSSKLQTIAGNIAAAKDREEVATATVDYLTLVCAKNLTKVGWVSDALTNGSLPIEFTTDVLVGLAMDVDNPDKVTTADVGQIVVGEMCRLDADYVQQCVDLMGDPVFWESEGFDPQDQPVAIERVTNWMENSGYVSLLSLAHAAKNPTSLLALYKNKVKISSDLPMVLGQVVKRRMKRYIVLKAQRRHQREAQLYCTDSSVSLRNKLLGGTSAMSLLAGDSQDQAVNKGQPAAPETLQFAQWLSWNASDTSKRFEEQSFDYSGSSSSQSQSVGDKVMGMLNKISGALDTMKEYASESGQEKMKDVFFGFPDRAADEIVAAFDEKLQEALAEYEEQEAAAFTYIKGLFASHEDGAPPPSPMKAVNDSGLGNSTFGNISRQIANSSIGEAIERYLNSSDWVNESGGVLNATGAYPPEEESDVNELMQVTTRSGLALQQSAPKHHRMKKTLTGAMALHRNWGDSRPRNKDAERKSLVQVSAHGTILEEEEEEPAALFQTGSEVTKAAASQVNAHDGISLGSALVDLADEPTLEPTLAPTLYQPTVAPEDEGLLEDEDYDPYAWEELSSYLANLKSILPEVTDSYKLARRKTSDLGSNLAKNFGTFKDKGSPIFDDMSDLYAILWTCYYALFVFLTFLMLLYGFWGSGWCGGCCPNVERTDEDPEEQERPYTFLEKIQCCCAACGTCITRSCGTSAAFWSIAIFFQIIALILFIVSIVLTLVGGIKAFLSAGCGQVYVLTDPTVCTTYMETVEFFLQSFLKDTSDLAGEVCEDTKLTTCQLIADELKVTFISITVGSIAAAVLTFQLVVEAAIVHERHRWMYFFKEVNKEA